MLKRFLNGAFGNFVKDYPPKALLCPADELLQMPGNRLALAVTVGRQVHCVRVVRQLLQVGNDLLFAGQHLVTCCPIIVGIDTHPRDQLGTRVLPASGLLRFLCTLARWGRPTLRLAAGRQVAHVADTGLHNIIAAQVAVDRPGFGRRFDYDKVFGHTYLPPLYFPLVAVKYMPGS